MRILSKLFFLTVIAISSSFGAYAEEGFQQQMQNPVKEVSPYVQSDKATVIVFFKYGCPACRSLHQSLVGWGSTLPRGISFQMMPILESDDQGATADTIMGLQTFWVVDKIGTKTQQDSFSADAYTMVQDEGKGGDRSSWLNLILSEGINKQKAITAWKSEIPLTSDRFARQLHYAPTATPTMVICGKWMISPDVTQGDIDMFAKLANGLVSRCMEQNGIKVKSTL